MSRIGKRPVAIPEKVTITTGGGFFEVKGPRGVVKRPLPEVIEINVRDGAAQVTTRSGTDASSGSRIAGTTRSHLNNAVTGVSKGYFQSLKLEGTGYKAELKGTALTLSLGLSHPVVYQLPTSVSLKIPAESKNTVLQLETYDKDVLGQVVAQLQSFRPPEPYKGKGVRLVKPGKPGLLADDLAPIRRKAGKAGKGSK